METLEFHTKFTFVAHNKDIGNNIQCEDEHLRHWHIMGVGSGWGAGDMGTADGPRVLLENIPPSFEGVSVNATYWHHLPVNIPHKIDLSSIEAQIHADHVLEMAIHHCKQAKDSILRGETPLIFGGDHSIAIGTWSGVKAAIDQDHFGEDMGLIWIDAHLDAHTFQTSPSLNVHGMPVAVLLGYGDERFTNIGGSNPKLKPENLCLIGIRSFEEGEEQLLRQLGVKVYLMKEVEERGFATVFKEARSKISASRFGVSIDVDAFDPEEAPGTGTPESLGLHLKDVRSPLQGIAREPGFLALEITEFNPHLDRNNKTVQLAWELATIIKGDIS